MVQEGRSIAKWNLGELQVIYEAAKTHERGCKIYPESEKGP